MPTIDLNPYRPEPLVLSLNGRDWEVPPPSSVDGMTLAAIITMTTVASVSPEQVAELPEQVTRILKDHADEDVSDLALTPEVHAAMVEAGVSAPDIDHATQAAAFFWVTGSTDASVGMLDALTGREVEAPKGEQGSPKGSSRQPTGPLTGSESPTPTAGTPTTGRRPLTSDHRPPRKRSGKRKGHNGRR